MITNERGAFYLSGDVVGLAYPVRPFPCKSPREVRAELPPHADVIAFQCRNPIHRAHFELFTRALTAPNVSSGPNQPVVMVHPTCGPTQPGDIDGAVRFRTYEVLKAQVANPRILWNYLPYSMHMAGPREALHHMIIRKNYGCSHFIIGRDMAGCKNSTTKEDIYGAYDAQEFGQALAGELNVQVVPSLNLVYTEAEGYVTVDAAEQRGLKCLKLSGTRFREMLRNGDDIPEWFAFPSVVDVLRGGSGEGVVASPLVPPPCRREETIPTTTPNLDDPNNDVLPKYFSSGAELKKSLMHRMIRYKDPQDFQGFHELRISEDKPCSLFYDHWLIKGEFWVVDMPREGLVPRYVKGKRMHDAKVEATSIDGPVEILRSFSTDGLLA